MNAGSTHEKCGIRCAKKEKHETLFNNKSDTEFQLRPKTKREVNVDGDTADIGTTTHLVVQREGDACVFYGVVGLPLDVDVEEVVRQEAKGDLPLPGKRPQVDRVDHLLPFSARAESSVSRGCGSATRAAGSRARLPKIAGETCERALAALRAKTLDSFGKRCAMIRICPVKLDTRRKRKG